MFVYNRLIFVGRSLYCKEHYGEFRGVGKRKKAAGKGKGKTNSNAACDPVRELMSCLSCLEVA